MVALARSIYEGGLNLGTKIPDVVYTCTMYGACAKQCGNIYYLTKEYFNVPYLVEKMREELVNRAKVPSSVRDYLKSVNLYGNTYQMPGDKRGKWAEGIGIPSYSGQGFLFYVGHVGSFDERRIGI